MYSEALFNSFYYGIIQCIILITTETDFTKHQFTAQNKALIIQCYILCLFLHLNHKENIILQRIPLSDTGLLVFSCDCLYTLSWC